MINSDKLKGKIVENGLNVSKVAERLGINKSTLYRKINNGGLDFSIREARTLAKILNLTSVEVDSIFFNFDVAHNANFATESEV